jgi:putative Ca2+/H+ antiporter (TMEM165/GDT1 family)
MNDLGFTHAFIASLSVIIVSELGDKTFFIAAIMAMRHSRIVVFTGAILALVVMTIISGKAVKKITFLMHGLNSTFVLLNFSFIWMGYCHHGSFYRIIGARRRSRRKSPNT